MTKFIGAAFAATLFLSGTAYAGGEEVESEDAAELENEPGPAMTQRHIEAAVLERRLGAVAVNRPDLQPQIDELRMEIEALKNAPSAPNEPPPPQDLSGILERLTALENAPVSEGNSSSFRGGLIAGLGGGVSPVPSGVVDSSDHDGLLMGFGNFGGYLAWGGTEQGDLYGGLHGYTGRGSARSEPIMVGGALGSAISDGIVIAVAGEMGIRDLRVRNGLYRERQLIGQIGPQLIGQVTADDNRVDLAFVGDLRLGAAQLVGLDMSGLVFDGNVGIRIGFRDQRKGMTEESPRPQPTPPAEDEVIRTEGTPTITPIEPAPAPVPEPAPAPPPEEDRNGEE
jgi:hypothetical protein